MSTHPGATCTLLPPGYATRLRIAAASGDIQRIDAITDELAACYPRLVRLRSDDSRFGRRDPWQREEGDQP